MDLHINPFRCGTEKEAARKVVEEAAEAFSAFEDYSAWDTYWENDVQEDDKPAVRLADELADCITACCNLADRYGIDLQAALDRVEKHNRERGRYA